MKTLKVLTLIREQLDHEHGVIHLPIAQAHICNYHNFLSMHGNNFILDLQQHQHVYL